jgi:hypothetical protein
MRELDLLYSTKHAAPEGGNLVNKKQVSGGYFTMAAGATVLVLVVSSLVQFSTSNTIVRSTIEPGVPGKKTLDGIEIVLQINSKTNCQVVAEFGGFPMSFFQNTEYRDNTCFFTFSCELDCEFNFGKEV